MATWQQAAWYVHSHGLAPDAIPMSQLETALPGGDRTPTIRALDQIIDRRTLHGTVVGEFIHYSFYEYLLARQIRDGLTSNVSARQAINLLRRDLSREIRHHLVGQLQDLTDNELGDRLCVLYGDVRVAPDLHPADRLTVCNLLVYLVSRTSSEARRQLDTLLAGERDAFLLNSLLWALCHHRSMPALEQFFALLQQDATFRACSRGYVLYYYGDIRTGQPPFLDDLPYRSHERTSSKVLAIFEDEAFLTVPPQRRYIDLYTFMDIYLVRREKIDDRALSVLQPAVDALGGEDLTSEMKDRLTDMLREISRRPIPDPASTSFVSSTQQEAERP